MTAPNPPPPPPPKEVPQEIRGWNWGAFLLNWIWAIRHRVWMGLWMLAPIPALWIGMPIVLGVKGSQWAWEKRDWTSVQEFKTAQKRWAIGGLVTWVLVLPLIVWGVVTLISQETSTQIVTGSDGRFSLSIPGSWEMDDSLNAEADLGASNVWRDAYVIVVADERSAIPKGVTLSEFSDVARDTLTREIPEDSKLGSFSIGGHDALEYELRGIAEGENVVWLHTSIKTDAYFVQVIAWTHASRYSENVTTLQDVIRSFRVR